MPAHAVPNAGYSSPAIESFSTETLIHDARADAWNAIYSSQLATADFIPHYRDFSAGLALGGLGQLCLARLVTGPCTIRRTIDHIGPPGEDRIYTFLIQLKGTARFTQGGQDSVLHRGDIIFCDNGTPHSNQLGGNSEMLLVRVGEEVIQDYLPYPEALRGRALCAREGVASIAAGMACSLWRQVERGFDPAHADSIAHQLLDMFATSYRQAYGAEMSGPFDDAALHARAVTFIEEMIRDSGLSARCTAEAAGVKLGRLLGMFHRRGDTFVGFVTRRRIDQAARQLRNPRWRGSTISEVAYSVGYKNVPMFTRAFSDRMGVSARDYRRTHQD